MNVKKLLSLITVNFLVFGLCLVIADLFFGFAYKGALTVPEKSKKTFGTTKTLPKHLISPYLGWIETPGKDLTEFLDQSRLNKQSENDQNPYWLHIPNNNMGFVSKYNIPLIKKPNDFLILVLGGSVARWFALQSQKEFLEQLKQHKFLRSKNIILLNMATGGYKQPQQLNLFSFLLITHTIPDIVLNIDGFNEAALSYNNLINEVSPIYPSSYHWAQLIKGNTLTPEISETIGEHQNSIKKRDFYYSLYEAHTYSHILSFIFTRLYDHWDIEAKKHEITYTKKVTELSMKTSKVSTQGPLHDVGLKSIADIWINSSKLMQDIASKKGIRYFHFLQPTAHDPDSLKNFTPDEIKLIGSKNHIWAQGVHKLYPVFKSRANELVDYGILYKDLTNIFVDTANTLYYDICHFNQKGNDIFAKSIAEQIKNHY